MSFIIVHGNFFVTMHPDVPHVARCIMNRTVGMQHVPNEGRARLGLTNRVLKLLHEIPGFLEASCKIERIFSPGRKKELVEYEEHAGSLELRVCCPRGRQRMHIHNIEPRERNRFLRPLRSALKKRNISLRYKPLPRN